MANDARHSRNFARPSGDVGLTRDEFDYVDLLESESSDSDEEVYSKIQNRKKDSSKHLSRPRTVAPASSSSSESSSGSSSSSSRPTRPRPSSSRLSSSRPSGGGGAGDADDCVVGLAPTADRLLLNNASCRPTSLVDETSTPITIRKEGYIISKQLSFSSSSSNIRDGLPLKRESGKLSRPTSTTFSRPSSRPSATTTSSSSTTTPTTSTTINSIPKPTDFDLKSPVRRYENKTQSAFITGFNVMSKEAYTKRSNRAKRFGIEHTFEKEVAFIIPKEGAKINGNLVRPEALFVRGVDNMSTQDVFRYFGSYGPSSIEWLNDTSCNVVWLDPNTTARALMGMSHPHYINKGPMIEEITPRIDVKSHDNTLAAEPMEQDDDDYVDLINDSETGERVRIPRRPCQELVDRCNTQNRSTTEDADMEVEKAEEEKPFEVTEEEALRDALPFAKSEHLQIRYATKADKKQVGAQNRSWYYIRHGNPNYNGMKGIISNSMKKRISDGKSTPTTRTSRKRRMETCVDEDKVLKRERTSPHGDGDAENLEQEVKLITRAPSPKRVMRMYADDVEQQVKNIRKLSAPVGLQVVIEPDHHNTINRIGGEMNGSGIIRRIGRHPLRGAVEGAKRSEHHNLFPDLRGKLNNRKTSRRLLSENSNISVEIGDDLQ